MKLKRYGSLEEWLQFNPKAFLTNKNFIKQKGVAFYNFRKEESPQKCTYPIGYRPDYEDTENMHVDPMIYFGPQAPYMVKGYFTWFSGVIFYPSGAGASFPISDNMAADSNWENYEIEDYLNE
jgi:hypothetical protein